MSRTFPHHRLRGSHREVGRQHGEALRPLIGAIDVALMRAANLRASRGDSPRAAAEWLWSEVGRK